MLKSIKGHKPKYACSVCKHPATASDRFCRECGGAIEMIEIKEEAKPDASEAQAPEANAVEAPATVLASVCPQCGRVSDGTKKFCSECGVAFVEKEIPAPTKKKNLSLAPLKALTEKLGISAKRLALIGCLFVAAVVAIVILCNIMFGGSSEFIEVKKDLFCENSDTNILIFANGRLEDSSIGGSYDSYKTCADGSTMAILTKEGDLYVYDKKPEKLASEVEQYEISQSGEGLIYVDGDDELYLWTKGGKPVKLSDELAFGINGCVISPDGKTVAFAEGDYDDPTLYTSGEKGEKQEIDDMLYPLAISDGAELVYYFDLDDGAICVLNSKRDKEEEICDDMDGTAYWFNADHTQIIVQDGGKSYISIDGAEPEKLCSNIREIGRRKTAAFGTTTDVIDFRGQYVLDTKGDLYFIKDNLETEKVARDVEDFDLSEDCKTLFYIDDGGAIFFGSGKGKDDFEKLVKEAYSFYMTPDGRGCYFEDENSVLYYIAAKKDTESAEICDEVYDVSMTHDGYILFMRNDNLYSSNGGKSIRLVDKDVEYVFCTDTAAYYVSADTALASTTYGTSKKTGFKEIFSEGAT